LGIRANLASIFGAKASILGLPPGDQPDRPLEKLWDDNTILSTYGDDPWPYICATKVAEQGSLPPLRFGRENADGEFTAVPPTHGIQQLFDRPNPLNTGGEFRHLLLLYLEMLGHAPIEVVRPSPGAHIVGMQRKGFELYVHNPGPWRIVANADGSVRGYIYLTSANPVIGTQATPQGKPDVKWDSTQMTYLRWPNPINRWYGQGRIAAVRQAVMAEEYAGIRDKRFEQQMGVPPGILTSEMPLGTPQAEELQRRWEKAVGGYTNAGRIAVLGSKTTYQSVSLNARDSEWLLQRHFRVEQIAAAFEVPLVLVIMSEATYANAKEARAEWWEGSLLPKLNRIEEMVSERLVPMLTDEPLVARFDYSRVAALQENADEVAAIAVKWVQTASATKGEVREKIGLQPFTGALAPLNDTLALPTTFRDTLAAASFDAADPNAAVDAATAAEPKTPLAPGKRQKRREPKAREDILAPARDAYKDQLSTFFATQRKYVLGELGKAAKALPEDEGQSLLDRAIAIINTLRFRDRLAKISEPAIKAAFTLGVEDAAETMGIHASFAIGASPEALRAVNARLVSLANSVQGTTTADVTKIISDGLAAGDDSQTIRDNLSTLFDGYQDWRLDRISRTETTNAYNVGSVGQYRDAGVSQVYVTDGDGDDECAAADGSTWSVDEAESDPSAHPNCTRSFDPIPPDEAPTPSDTIDPEASVEEAAPPPSRTKRTRFEYDDLGRLIGLIDE
jgi:phage portal protein BeeE